MPVLIVNVLRKFQTSVEQALANASAGTPIRTMFKMWGEHYRSWAQERFSQYSRGGGNWPPLKPSTIARRSDVRKKSKQLRASFRSRNRADARFLKAYHTHAQKGTDKTAARLEAATAARTKAWERVGLARERKLQHAGSAAILWDKGVLRMGLNPTLDPASGGHEAMIPYGVQVGYGGPALHPVKPGGEKRAPVTIAQIAAWHNAGAPPYLPKREIIAQPGDDSVCMKLMAREAERALGQEWRLASA